MNDQKGEKIAGEVLSINANPKKKWYQSKSNAVVIVGAICNIVAAIIGQPLPTWVNEALVGAWAIFMRMGIENTKNDAEFLK